MFSRRRFLGAGGAGLLALSGGCSPLALQPAAYGDEPGDAPLGSPGNKSQLLGYPINMNTPADAFFQWRRKLAKAGIDVFAFNNVGNPFNPSPIAFNTHDYERETIRAFGRLYAFPTSDTWGFLSHSGTDSNMHGMYMGRTLLKGRTGAAPKAYFTREAHYSVQILRDLLGVEGVVVGTLPDGGMDPNHLADKLAENKDAPALVVATVGTTFKGAIDNLDRIQEVLGGVESYVHLDAALFGGYLPFTRHAGVVAHQVDDAAPRYDSIAVSCHKFFGFPSPAGIFVARKTAYEEFNELFSRIHNPEYIHHVPGTITCSRDAVKPAEFHYFTTTAARIQQREDADRMLKNAGFLLEELHKDVPELEAVRSNPLSNTIYFKNPGNAIVKKYSLATMHLEADGKSAEYAHVVVMPHVTKQVLSEFLADVGQR